MGIHLTIENGRGRPLTYAVEADRIATLGRHANNTIVLNDEHASRWHALIYSEGGRWLLSHVGAPVNGTRVNGVLVQTQAELLHGHEITIGDTQLRVVLDRERSHVAPPILPMGNDTPLSADELAIMYTFLNLAVVECDHQALIRLTLETVARRTKAAVAGYLNLAPEPLAKIIYPEQEHVDVQLSRQLTRQVQHGGRSVWAAGPTPTTLSGSLYGYSDALCVPVRAAVTGGGDSDDYAGAIHLYRLDGTFTERHQCFCEVIAGCLAGYLAALRIRRSLQADNARLISRSLAAELIIGDSAPMHHLREQIARAAANRSTVLIQGETGVGKELVALALHRQSPRGNAPLVVVNCATITGSLIEAQLFGSRKGAFTGADRDRPGLFEEADEGTLFLDEIGELPLECQAKVLRVIEGHGFRPVGATAEVRTDVRIIAATNRDLEDDAAKGKFRRDLLYRLQVIQLPVPPLREHAADIPALIAYYLAKLTRSSRTPIRIADAALRELQDYSWPGNVRQLLAVLESAVAMSDGTTLQPRDFRMPKDAVDPKGMPLNLEALETMAVRQALIQTHGNITRAAKLLGVCRDTLAAKMKQIGISRSDP